MRKFFANLSLVVAAVGVALMLGGLISISMVPSEVQEGIATYAQGAEVIQSNGWTLIVGVTTAALGFMLWVIVRERPLVSRRHLFH